MKIYDFIAAVMVAMAAIVVVGLVVIFKGVKNVIEA